MIKRKDKIRVLYIHHGKGLGGALRSLEYLLRKLDRNLYEPTILLLYDSDANAILREMRYPVIVAKGISKYRHTAGGWYNVSHPIRLISQHIRIPFSIKNAAKYISTIDPDLVHLNSSSLFPCAIAAKILKKRVVWHIREHIVDGYIGIRKKILSRIITRFADEVIAICEANRDRIERLPSEKAKVIYNFVDFKVFDRSLDGSPIRREFRIPSAAKIVSMLGGVSEIKGTVDFVRAALLLSLRERNWYFLVVGKSKIYGEKGIKALIKQKICEIFKLGAYPARRKVRHLLETGSLAGRLIFTEYRSDIPNIIAASDLVVFPSTVPHFARPIIEAGAMAKPIVASDLEGPRELVVNGGTGLLVEPNNPKALARAISGTLTDDMKARRFGETGYRRAKELFDADKNAKATFEVYEKVLFGK